MIKINSKTDIIKILVESANKYKQNLLNKNIMFIFQNKNEKNLKYIETIFKSQSFLHLTGLKFNGSANVFFYNCLNHTLSLKDIELKNKVYTKLKLEVLENAMSIDQSAKRIGNYNNNGIELKIEKVIGGVHYCIGFSNKTRSGKELDYYYPKSLLKTNIVQYSTKDNKVVAILSKNVKDEKYCNITYFNNDKNIIDIIKYENIKKKIDIVNLNSKNIKYQEKINKFTK